ncbi:MAG: GNAT family N-acetyltransferase [Cyclobacteriaceae bacterium]|nr:GNAT family N-acetyltransferase [Cyclobacteriaceae bacterium]
MKIVYQIQEEEYKYRFQPLLFNTSRHRKLQSPEAWYSFYLIDEQKHEIWAEFHVCHSANALNSPLRAPYGGFSANSMLGQERFDHFSKEVAESIEIPTLSSIEIKVPPHLFDNQVVTWQENILCELGYKINNKDPHWFLPITGSSYTSKLKSTEYKRKLNRLRENNFLFKVETLDEYLDAYRFISDCMRGKGYKISMSEKDFVQYLEKIPDDIRVFSVFFENKRVAASICFKVNETTLYDFMHAHLREMDTHSPVLKLFDGIYEYGRNHMFHYLDMGTASLEGKPNYPLIHFKELAGGIIQNKFIWGKDINPSIR